MMMKESKGLLPGTFDESVFLLNRSALQRRAQRAVFDLFLLSHISCCIVNAAWVREEKEEEEEEGKGEVKMRDEARARKT